jgi:peptidoglycan hydrolase CwlO-like protein
MVKKLKPAPEAGSRDRNTATVVSAIAALSASLGMASQAAADEPGGTYLSSDQIKFGAKPTARPSVQHKVEAHQHKVEARQHKVDAQQYKIQSRQNKVDSRQNKLDSQQYKVQSEQNKLESQQYKLPGDPYTFGK